MENKPSFPRRKNIRLSGYDYACEGGYFITIVTKDREAMFGSVVNGEMVLNEFGRIVEVTWLDLVNHNVNIGLDDFVVMPNHIHGIVVIFEPTGVVSPVSPVGAGSQPARMIRAGLEPAPTKNNNNAPNESALTRKISLPEIVRQLKTFSARRINILRGTPGAPVWQRNYYDRVIRSDREYEEVAAYIANNPANWLTDAECPADHELG